MEESSATAAGHTLWGPASSWLHRENLASAAKWLTAVVVLVELLQLRLRWRYRKVPGPMPWPILGNMVQMANAGLHIYLEQCRARYGPLFKVWLGPHMWVTICDPEIARIANNKFLNRVKVVDLVHAEDGLIGTKALLGSRDAYWRMLRLNWQVAFRSTSLEGFSPLMNKSAVQLAERLSTAASNGTAVDIHKELGNMSLHVVGSSAYGVDFQTLDVDQAPQLQQVGGQSLVAAVRTVFSGGGMLTKPSVYQVAAILFPIFEWPLRKMSNLLPDKNLMEMREAEDTVKTTSLELIKDWRAKSNQNQADKVETPPEKGSNGQTQIQSCTTEQNGAMPPKLVIEKKSKGIAPGSFLGLMLGATDFSKTRTLTDKEVAAQASTFTLAGYETTANALAFAVYNLCNNKEAEQKMLGEIDAYFEGGDKELPNTLLDQNFPFVEAVVNETLRLFPPGAVLTREASETMQLGLYKIYKGCSIFTSLYSIHRDANIWPEAESFKPERFMTEAQIALIRLYQVYTFEVVDDKPLKTQLHLTLGPVNGISVRVVKRQRRSCHASNSSI